MAKKEKTQTYKNYIFDFDGTLADSLPALIAVFNKNIRGNESPLTPEEIQRFRGMTSRQAIRMAGVRWWQLPKVLMRAMPDFYALMPTLQPFEGIPEVIKKLHARGDKLFIVTSNSNESVNVFLEKHNLTGYFTDIMSNAGLFNKGRMIRRLIRDNNLKRRDSIYIGDETRDVRAARLARIKPVSVTWGFNNAKILKKQRPAYVVSRPSELLNLTPKRKK